MNVKFLGMGAAALIAASFCTPSAYAQAPESSDPIKIALFDWTSVNLNAKIMGGILEKLGYTVEYPTADYLSSLTTGLTNGDLTLAMEFWDTTAGEAMKASDATGMTEKLGAIKLGDDNSEPFLGRDLGHTRNYSENVAAIVDEQVKLLLSSAHQEAYDILEENRDVLDSLVLALLDKETLDKEEVAEIFKPLRKRPPRPAWTGSPTRSPSSIPPVDVPQAVRERAAANGASSHDTSEGGVILTPPGSGGDVHGDPGVSSDAD